MKGFLAVARREIEEKWFVFPAALVASLVPFAIPLLRGMHGAAAVEVREWCALVGASTLAVGLAALLGGTVIASDLAERRLGFYFSRPITGFALWAGKLGTAGFIALAAAAIVYAPTLAVNGGRVIVIDLPRQSPFLFLAGVAAIVLVMHAGNVLMRPRSSLLALDLAALVLLTLAAVFVLQKLIVALAVGALRFAIVTLIGATLIGFILAGLKAVTRGRSDGRAAHRALSATLWSILATGVAATAGFAAWVFAVAPKDLAILDWVEPASRGSWIRLTATARGWQPNFLYDTATGRYRRAGSSWRGPVLSPNGTRAAWFEPTAQGGPYELMTWRLDQPDAKPVRTLILPTMPYMAFLSNDGERLATIAGGVLSVWDPETRTSLGSARLADERAGLRGFFVDPNRVRVLRFKYRWQGVEENTLDILEFDLSTKTLATIVTLADASACIESETGDRLLVTGKSSLTLRDGRTGALLASLAERSRQRRVAGRFTSEGHIVVAVAEDSDAPSAQAPTQSVHVEVLTRDGRRERTLAFPGFEHLTLGGEVAPGLLVLGVSREPMSEKNRVIYLVNLATGELKPVAEGLTPIRTLSEAGSEGAKLYFGPGHSLVHFDALTGERRLILGRGDPF